MRPRCGALEALSFASAEARGRHMPWQLGVHLHLYFTARTAFTDYISQDKHLDRQKKASGSINTESWRAQISSGHGEVTLTLGRDLRAHTSFAHEEEFFTEKVEPARHLLVPPLGRHSVCHLRTERERSRRNGTLFQLTRPGATSRGKHEWDHGTGRRRQVS